MHDMTAFEHQVENVLQHAAGPSLPVDAVATVDAATTGRWTGITRRFRRGATTETAGGFAMVSAVKFVVAGVIVALFGGFLLVGVLTTQQGDEAAPAAATESPSPTTTEELFSGMVTEEVEPGVYRVVSEPHSDWLRNPEQVAVSPEGDVWVWQRHPQDGGFVVEVGVPGRHRLRGGSNIADLAVTADGTVWLTTLDEDARYEVGIQSYDGESWRKHPSLGAVLDLHLGADDTLWAADWLGVWSFRDGLWKHVGGDVVPDLARFMPLDLATTPDGVVWLGGDGGGGGIFHRPDSGGLVRYDGESFTTARPLGGADDHAVPALASDTDGTLWALVVTPPLHPKEDVPPWQWETVPYLARFDGSEWTAISTDDGLPDVRNTQRWPSTVGNGDRLVVGKDGVVWLAGSGEDEGFAGVAAFDGATWTRFLEGEPVQDLDLGPGGWVWVASSDERGDVDRVGLYVITPEAVAATE